MAPSVTLNSSGIGGKKRDFSGEEESELTFVQTDSSSPFLGFLIIREKYKQDPRRSKDKVSVSDDS